MRKLNLQEKEIVMKKYGKVGYLVIAKVEKLKLDYTLDEAMDFAYDILQEQAE